VVSNLDSGVLARAPERPQRVTRIRGQQPQPDSTVEAGRLGEASYLAMHQLPEKYAVPGAA
jgi:hypothetical protein